jgi:hypothetical protein
LEPVNEALEDRMDEDRPGNELSTSQGQGSAYDGLEEDVELDWGEGPSSM